jgi:hypothetical protein
MKAMSRLVSVLRRPELMLAVWVERARPFEAAPDGEPFRARTAPLSQTPESICPWRDKDVRAWKSLGRVPRMTPRAAQAVVRALISSVALPTHEPTELPELVYSDKSPMDLRPHLCQLDGELLLLQELDEAIPRDTTLPSWHFERRRELAELPAKFRHYLLWGGALSSWEQIELTLAAYETLGLESDEPSLQAVALIFTLCSREDGLWWCDLLAELEPSVRAHAISVAIEAEILAKAPDAETREQMQAGKWAEVLLRAEA